MKMVILKTTDGEIAFPPDKIVISDNDGVVAVWGISECLDDQAHILRHKFYDAVKRVNEALYGR